MATGNVTINPKSVTFGGTSITGVTQISWQEQTDRIAASGDDDQHETFQDRGITRTSGTITFRDNYAAMALRSKTGTLTWVEKGGGGGSDHTYTITNCEVFGTSPNQPHRGASTVSITFNAISSDGSVAPASVS